MKKQPLIFSLLLLFPLYIKAQSTAPKPDRQKHEFALDVQDVFNGFRESNLIYKRRIEGKKTVRLDQTSRLRFQVGFSGQAVFLQEESERNNDGFKQSYYESQKKLSYKAGIGYEIQRPLKEGFEICYGIDAMSRYAAVDDDVTNLILNGISYDFSITTDIKLRNIQLGITPFIGFNYAINNYLRVGIETAWDISYFRSRNTLINKIDGDELIYSTGLISRFRPIRFINLSVRFN